MKMQILLCLAALSMCIDAAVESDLVTDLPGLSWTPNYKHYSGYLKATGTKKLHYWFLESAGNPKTDPVVLWMNGGPGCSSMDGLLSEHGPFLVAPDGKSLTKNQYSWNTVANMLYLEAPAGVGYSYSDDKNYTTDDDQVSLDNYEALKYFFDQYPEYKTNDFYITGESYGGVYVPTLSVRVAADSKFNFKGFAIGNGITDWTINSNSLIYFGYFHGLLSVSLWSKMMSSCCNTNNPDQCDFIDSTSADCQNAVNEAQMLMSGLNIYNLYEECHTAGSLRASDDNTTIISPVDFLFSRQMFSKLPVQAGKSLKVKEVPPCINVTALTMFMNSASVRKAIHIPDSLPEWEICSGVVGGHYKRLYTTLKPQYLELLATGKYRVVIYNGDVDMACNFLGCQWFVDSLKQKVVKEWSQWFYKSPVDQSEQVAGFIKQYKNIAFMTIKGAGHMVPQNKPIPALGMFKFFLNGKF